MKDLVDHIMRPTLPWRQSGAITECGYDATKVRTLSRAEYARRFKDMGQQRTAMITCMTCIQTAARYSAWQDDPRTALEREINWESAWRKERGTQLLDELLAIEALIAAHPDEFRQIIDGKNARRDWVQRKGRIQSTSA